MSLSCWIPHWGKGVTGELALWQERFRDFLELNQWAARTTDEYVRRLKPLFAFLEAEGVRILPEVTREHLDAYRTHLFYREYHGRKLGLAAQANYVSGLKVFFRFLAEERYLLVNPAEGMKQPKLPQLLPRRLPSERELARVLQTPDVSQPLGLRDRAILELLYSSALRNTELRDLVLSDYLRERRELAVRRGKGGKSRVVPLGEVAAAWLDRYLTEGRPWLARPESRQLFLTCRGRQLLRTDLGRMVARATQAAGLPTPLTPHQFRHACATHMLRRGARIRHLQALLGHASLQSTQRYTRVEIEDLHRVHRKYHPRERQ